MADYDSFSTFYDRAMGDRGQNAADTMALVREHVPRGETVLELACGTGALLEHFARDYAVTGLDRSEGMLAVARKRLPEARLERGDMTAFDLGGHFDAVVCLFDSINHLLDFEDWKRVFVHAKRHLAPGGVFIFDMNTADKLRSVIAAPPWVTEFDGNTMVMTVTDAGRGVSNWNVRIFERQEGDTYRLHEENIQEVVFSMPRVLRELEKVFDRVKTREKFRKSPHGPLESMYFICQ